MYQVEYAIEAIGHAGICIGILATDGVLLGVEKKIASKLLEITTSEKMYKVVAAISALCCPAPSSARAARSLSHACTHPTFQIGDHVGCAMAGITADANILIDKARLDAQRYELK